MKEYSTEFGEPRCLDSDEFERLRAARMQKLAFRLVNDGTWKETEPDVLDRILPCSKLEFITRLDDDAGTLLQIFRDENGYTLYGLATTYHNGRIVTLQTEITDEPIRCGLDLALDRLKAEA